MKVNEKTGQFLPPQFSAKEEKGATQVPPSAGSGSMTIGKDGKITSGKSHIAREGRVTNPGVRRVSVDDLGPTCPKCKRTGTLKMRMNRGTGKRIYCAGDGCDYDQSTSHVHAEGGIKPNPDTKIMDSRIGRSNDERGVQIIRQGPRG